MKPLSRFKYIQKPARVFSLYLCTAGKQIWSVMNQILDRRQNWLEFGDFVITLDHAKLSTTASVSVYYVKRGYVLWYWHLCRSSLSLLQSIELHEFLRRKQENPMGYSLKMALPHSLLCFPYILNKTSSTEPNSTACSCTHDMVCVPFENGTCPL